MFADKLTTQELDKVTKVFNVFSLKHHNTSLTDNQFKLAFEFIVNQKVVYPVCLEPQIKTIIYKWSEFEETVSETYTVDLPNVLVEYNTEYGLYYAARFEKQSPFYSQLLDVYRIITRMKQEQK